MKKVSTLFMVTAMYALSAGAAVSSLSNNPANRLVQTEAVSVQGISPQLIRPTLLNPTPFYLSYPAPYLNFLKLTPNQFQEATGQKLNFFQKIKFKIAQKIAGKAAGEGGKAQTTAALLAFFLGGLGIHRFYLGYTWQGVVQLLTFGGLGIWAIIDFVRILTGSLQPKDGSYE
jgi:TM2 domain-containing membrane protein YozV